MLKPNQPSMGVAHKQEEPLDLSKDSILLVQTVDQGKADQTQSQAFANLVAVLVSSESTMRRQCSVAGGHFNVQGTGG